MHADTKQLILCLNVQAVSDTRMQVAKILRIYFAQYKVIVWINMDPSVHTEIWSKKVSFCKKFCLVMKWPSNAEVQANYLCTGCNFRQDNKLVLFEMVN